MKQNKLISLGAIVVFLLIICSQGVNENFDAGKLNIWIPPNIPQSFKYSSNRLEVLDPKFSSMTDGNVCFQKPGYQYDGVWESKLKNEGGRGYRNWSLGHKNISKGTYCGKSPSFQYSKLYFPMKKTISPPDCPIPERQRDIKLCCV